MSYIPDLTYDNRVASFGYLERGHGYPRGEVSDAAFDRLVQFTKRPLGAWAGYHTCDLPPCGTDHPRHTLYYKKHEIPDQCSTDILVPAENFLYVAPALILHYIRCHQYLPPAIFLKAALECPEPGSDEYIAAINKVGLEFLQFPLSGRSQCSSET
jgi:hypothetical protein